MMVANPAWRQYALAALAHTPNGKLNTVDPVTGEHKYRSLTYDEAVVEAITMADKLYKAELAADARTAPPEAPDPAPDTPSEMDEPHPTSMMG